MNMRSFISLFIAVLICEVLLLVLVLPGLAGVPDAAAIIVIGTASPTDGSSVPSSSPTDSPIPTATPLVTPTAANTETQSITSTLPPFEPTSTATPTPTSPPATELLVDAGQNSYLPILYQGIITPTPTPTVSPTATPTDSPPETVRFCDSLSAPLPIPDNDSNGVSDYISIADDRIVQSVRLYLDISHTWVGDLVVSLSNQNLVKTIIVLNRPGPEPWYCSNNDIVTILGDAAAQPADDQCASYPHAISGIYLPTQSFSAFTAYQAAGTWRLTVSDHYPNDVGSLNHWCLETTLVGRMPTPTPTPPPVDLPSSAYVSGMSGQDQQLNLDCESRSAVDWAKHYGYTIDEIHFLNQLPTSDDPEAGFVGNPDGIWGYIPPNDYGVHALPIAAKLRDYGLQARAFKSVRWDDLRAAIASGNPVIVWIIGGSNFNLVNGTPHLYTAQSTGTLSVVAPYEHTVILIGYTPTDVTLLNGSHFVTVPLDQFLDSWSALDFMAVLPRP